MVVVGGGGAGMGTPVLGGFCWVTDVSLSGAWTEGWTEL